MAQKYEMGSKGWLVELRRIVEELFAAAPAGSLADLEYSVCEIYTDVPQQIAPSGRACWYWRVKSGKLEVGTSELDAADVKITVDYASVVPIGRIVFGDDAEAQRAGDALAQEAIKSGKMKIDHTSREVPAAFLGLHDALAEITA